MNLREDIKPITYLKTQSAKLIDDVSKNRRPVVITQNGEAKAVLQDVDSYEETKKTLLMLKLLAQGEADIRNNRLVPQEQVFARIEKKLKLRERKNAA